MKSIKPNYYIIMHNFFKRTSGITNIKKMAWTSLNKLMMYDIDVPRDTFASYRLILSVIHHMNCSLKKEPLANWKSYKNWHLVKTFLG